MGGGISNGRAECCAGIFFVEVSSNDHEGDALIHGEVTGRTFSSDRAAREIERAFQPYSFRELGLLCVCAAECSGQLLQRLQTNELYSAVRSGAIF